MELFFSLLILVPTVGVLVIGAIMLIGAVVIDVVAGVDGIVTGLRHRMHHQNVGTPVLHH